MNKRFEKFCMNLTGLHDPLAAIKITLLILTTWGMIIYVLYATTADMNSLAGHVNGVANELIKNNGGLPYNLVPSGIPGN